ncbi:MAG: DUF2905 domain-containing protein [Clostridia bacterium]|nr:DUF2905 domain-containing protein [Clostridia bacterium]
MGFENLGKLLISIALVLLVIGGIFILISKVGVHKLPGDIYIKRGNFTFYFPVVTCIVISIIISLIARFLQNFK